MRVFQATEKATTPFELPTRDPTPTDSELGVTSSGASDAGGTSSGVSDMGDMSSAASETGSHVTLRNEPDSERRKKVKAVRMAADIEKELGRPCVRADW